MPTSASTVQADVPVLIEDYVRRAAYDPEVYGLDTDAMLQGWLRILRRCGGELLTDTGVGDLERVNGEWRVETSKGLFCAPVVVNAAGAWASSLGRMAGAQALPLLPHRRTAALIAAPQGRAERAFKPRQQQAVGWRRRSWVGRPLTISANSA